MTEDAVISAAVAAARRSLSARPDVVAVRGGWKFKDGWITDERCVVVYVRRKLTPQELEAAGVAPLPERIADVPVDVAVAPLPEAGSFALLEMVLAAREPVSNYKMRPDLPLDLVDDRMEVIAHASPDAGWPVLSDFLSRVRQRLTVGMYEFTAPHVVQAFQTAFSSNAKTLSLVLQDRDEEKPEGTPTEHDFEEQQTVDALERTLAGRFSFAWASVKGPERLFDTSYHIKLAVRDSSEFWLSSGSWRSSNQPPFDPIADGDQTPPLIQQYDRDWHVVVSHGGLATLFEKHLQRDRDEAAEVQVESLWTQLAEPEVWVPAEALAVVAFAGTPVYRKPLRVQRPVKVQPLLTPDNYAAHVVGYIADATRTLYFQNQSLAPKQKNGKLFKQLLNALLEKQKDENVDTRIVIRSGYGSDRDLLTALKDYGFDTRPERVHLQKKLHAKGIVVDGESVLLGSHNWTTSGTAFNRDASLIFYDPEIAKYFGSLFEYDWDRTKSVRVNENLSAVEFVRPGDPETKPGKVRMTLSEWLGE
jgi:hypothetical protein